MGVQIGATWRLELNPLCSAALKKTAEPIVMPFKLRTRVDPRKHVLDGGSIPMRIAKGQFQGKEHAVIAVQQDWLIE